MDKLIYYPGFEIADVEWTKFALLYLDTLSPIIPLAGENQLSDTFRQLRDETDLLNVHRPSFKEGYTATLDALDQVERILTNPERYAPIFRRRDLISDWKRPLTHKIELFRDKFTDDWEHFCISRGLATESDNGLFISESLAHVYMTILAQTIADSKGGSVITDRRSLDRYSVFIRRTDGAGAQVLQTAQGVLELKLPHNIRHLSLESVIRHRNRDGFREKQRAFRRALDDFLTDAESGGSEEKFVASLGSTWSDLSDDVVKVGTGTLTFGLGVWILLTSPSPDVLKTTREIAAGATLAVGSIIGIRNVWENTKTKRHARRFLSDLKELKPQRLGAAPIL